MVFGLSFTKFYDVAFKIQLNGSVPLHLFLYKNIKAVSGIYMKAKTEKKRISSIENQYEGIS